MHRLLLVLLVSLTPLAVSAQTVGNAALLGCAAKVDDAERLTCYDSLARGVSAEGRAIADRRDDMRKVQAEAAATKAELARQAAEAAAEAAKRDSFGRAQTADERLDEVPVKITEVMFDKGRRAVFMLDNGQIWRQIEPFPLPPIKDNSSATLKRGALGSYRIKLEGTNRNIPVIRNR